MSCFSLYKKFNVKAEKMKRRSNFNAITRIRVHNDSKENLFNDSKKVDNTPLKALTLKNDKASENDKVTRSIFKIFHFGT